MTADFAPLENYRRFAGPRSVTLKPLLQPGQKAPIWVARGPWADWLSNINVNLASGGVAVKVEEFAMAKHEPVVIERGKDRSILKAACLCGAELDLGKEQGSPKEQFLKVRMAFARHRKERRPSGDISKAA